MTAPPALDSKDEMPRSAVAVSALGIVQILAWGSSYYLLAVLAAPISADLGWSLSIVIAGLSVGLLVSGLAAPHIGRLIQARGGRPVLAVGAMLMAIGQTLLGLSESLLLFFIAWLIIGSAMAASLYDAAFSTLGRLYGVQARGAITTLTLFGGFASTLCWPLSAYLVESLGWRETCFVYAGIQLLVSLPIILAFIPRVSHHADKKTRAEEPGARLLTSARERRVFLLLATILVIVGSTGTLVAAHLLMLLQSKGVALATAVSLGALVGPSQVAARIGEMALGRRYHPIWTLIASAALMFVGLSLLSFEMPVLFGAILLYGAGYGIVSIARGTVPLSIFGAARYSILMGRLAMPSLIAQATAPFIGALVLERFGVGGTIGFLATLVSMALIMSACLLVMQKREM